MCVCVPLCAQPVLTEIPFRPEWYEAGVELPITNTGKATEYADGMIVVYSQVCVRVRVSFAIECV